MTNNLITIGVITNAHGVKGAVKIKSFTENPEDIFAYAPVYNAEGLEMKITKIGGAKGLYMAQVQGCNNRTDAETIKGMEICVLRNQFPALEHGEYYHTDLVGCTVTDTQNAPIGTVKGLHNYGAGDLIEVLFTDKKNTDLFVFASDVGDIDVDNKTVVLHVPHAVYADENHTTTNTDDQ